MLLALCVGCRGPISSNPGIRIGPRALKSPMIAAGLDVVGNNAELLRRLHLRARLFGDARYDRLRWTIVKKPIERSKRFNARKRQARTLQRHVTEKELHWPRLGDLLNQFKNAGHGEAADSWVGNGPNKPLSPNVLEGALGGDRIQDLLRQTGLNKNDLLQGLSKYLPDAINHLTPNGRVPTEQEMGRHI